MGYRQFCMLYLYPLLLQAVKDVPLPPLAARLDRRHHAGARCAALLSFRDRFHRGLFTNVFLHARLETRYADRAAGGQGRGQARGLKKEIVVANVRKMRKLVERLDWDPPEGVWVAYGERNSYTDDDAAPQGRVRARGGHLAALGARLGHRRNNGRYSRIAAEGARPRRGGRRRPGADGAAVPRPARARATRRSSRSR